MNFPFDVPVHFNGVDRTFELQTASRIRVRVGLTVDLYCIALYHDSSLKRLGMATC